MTLRRTASAIGLVVLYWIAPLPLVLYWNQWRSHRASKGESP